MIQEQIIRYRNLLKSAMDEVEFSDCFPPERVKHLKIAEDQTAQALMLLRIEIKAAEATK